MRITTEIPKGFKKTNSGVIPDHWDIKLISEIGKVSSGGTPYTGNEEYWNGNINWCTPTDITALQGNKYLSVTKSKISESGLKNSSAKVLPTNSLIVCTRASIGKAAINTVPMSTNQGFKNISDFQGALVEFLYYRIMLDEQRLLRIANGSTFLEISKADFDNFQIPLPPLLEQQKIAEILSTWDDAITLTKTTIEELKKRNKGLAQQLLTGKKRLKGFEGEWEEQHLEHYFKERKETNNQELPLLSVGEFGVYPQTDSNKKDTSNKDKSKYKRICPGDIGYNTMRMWQGRSALSSLEGIVSPAYTIVTPKKNADAQFFAYLFKLDEVTHKFFRKSQGLVSDTLNCKFKDFKIVKVLTPPSIEEQTAIVSVLEKADKEVRLHQQQLNTLQEQKKGLMQKLLTGEIRVKTD